MNVTAPTSRPTTCGAGLANCEREASRRLKSVAGCNQLDPADHDGGLVGLRQTAARNARARLSAKEIGGDLERVA